MKYWNYIERDENKIADISKIIGVEPLCAQVLSSRGFSRQTSVEIISPPDVEENPLLIKNMDKLVVRLQQAMKNDEKTLIYGDYDADGVTSTYVLYTFLKDKIKDLSYKLPHREKDGYGLTVKAIEKAKEDGVQLIITVDNGISAIDAVKYARDNNIDIIITDHHLPPEILPDTEIIVNPQQKDDYSPYKNICGCGVALMIVAAMINSVDAAISEFSDIVSIGTIADCMDMTGINRTIIKHGMIKLMNPETHGLKALLKALKLGGNKAITSDTIAFSIVPKINAAGRMDSAEKALELLLANSYSDAETMAERLIKLNEERQHVERQITSDIIDKINSSPDLLKNSIMVARGENYNEGVIGIVASKLVEYYNRPAIVFTKSDGVYKGSARSVDGISMYELLTACKDDLLKFGGHAGAAGMSVSPEKYDDFVKDINDYVIREGIRGQKPSINIDAEIKDARDIKINTVNSISLLEPFGNKNPTPVFAVKNAIINSINGVSDDKHVRVTFDKDGVLFNGMLFRQSSRWFDYAVGMEVDVIISMSIYNGYNGQSVSSIINAIKPSCITNEYVDILSLYDDCNLGHKLSEEELSKLKVDRDDVTRVYRYVTTRNVHADNDYIVAATGGPELSARTMIALDILLELGLVKKENKNGESMFSKPEVPIKKELSESLIFKKFSSI